MRKTTSFTPCAVKKNTFTIQSHTSLVKISFIIHTPATTAANTLQYNTNTGGVFVYCSTMSSTLGKLCQFQTCQLLVVAINMFVGKKKKNIMETVF